MSHSRLYRDGALIKEDFPPDQVGELLARDKQAVVWLDITRPSESDLTLLAEQLGMHRLAIEDIVQQAQRAKLDRYDTHLFLNTYMVRLDPSGDLSRTEVSAFIKPRALITVRYDDCFDLRELLLRWDETAELARNGVAFLLYGLLDILIDGHFSAVQTLDASLEKVQSTIFDGDRMSREEIQRRIFTARRDLVRLRQVTLPMREVVNSLMRPTMHTVEPEMLPYYQDAYDHVLRVIEWTESLRDLNTNMLETNLMLQNNQLNQIVKKVTGWAAIIAVPAAVTGFFGQNLDFPWSHTSAEFYVAVFVTIGLAAGLYFVFRRKGWI